MVPDLSAFGYGDPRGRVCRSTVRLKVAVFVVSALDERQTSAIAQSVAAQIHL
jgi:hypothetical protein